jgi:hypothetical protein
MPALVRRGDRAVRSTTPARRRASLVWIDSREAFVARLAEDEVHLERLESDVPAHHRATGHVRHDPAIRHGGGGGHPQTADEPHRVEHLRRFIDAVADRLGPADDVLILGPGTVPEQLERHVAEDDAHHGRDRELVCEAAAHLTPRQLAARLRTFAGATTRRRTVGSARWSEPVPARPSGARAERPRPPADEPASLRERGRSR